MKPLRALVGRATHHTTRRAWRRFEVGLEDPASAQQEVLQEILRVGRRTAYARRYGLSDRLAPTGYQRQVPIVDAATVALWLARTGRGDQHLLVPGRPRFFERTSGTMGPSKLLPYTDLLLDQIRRGVHAWIHDLYRHDPRLLSGQQYWAVSPIGQRPTATPGGIRIGVSDDTAYLGRLAGWAYRQTLAVPPAVAHIPDVARWRSETLRHLVAASDLRLLSVWSPSFLQILLDGLRSDLASYLERLPSRRRTEVRRAVASGVPLAQALWPRLRLVSVWADGPSARPAERLRAEFPHATLQGKGLFATEGLVTIPLHDAPAPVVVPTAHFYEFIPLEKGGEARPLLLHELQPGARYTILLTTGGGLYRYRLDDIVHCVGRHDQTPMLRFEGRLWHTSDLVGEKLHESHVRDILSDLLPDAAFAMLAPEPVPSPHYVLLLDGDEGRPPGLLEKLETRLQENPQYAYARRLGQLGAVSTRTVPDGLLRYLELQGARGTAMGGVKPPALATDRDLVGHLTQVSVPEVVA